MALPKKAIRAIAIRRSIARRATGVTTITNRTPANDNGTEPMPAGLLADCVAAGGFDQNASYAS